jgi:hypothetical protein
MTDVLKYYYGNGCKYAVRLNIKNKCVLLAPAHAIEIWLEPGLFPTTA